MHGHGSTASRRRFRFAIASAVMLAGAMALAPAATSQTVDNADLPPAAVCDPNDTTEDPDTQGRVPQAAYDTDDETLFTCNTELIGRHGNSGGYKVERYIDAQGQECAFYDTTLLIGVDVVDTDGNTPGTFVLDVTDPANPVHTATIASPAFASPHESVLLNKERGLIAAVLANPVFFPGQVDIWDVSEDCTDPQFQSSLPLGTLGHESGFSPDGNTFWTASLHTPHVTAIDITDPTLPQQLWIGAYKVHGIAISPDGNRAYLSWFGDDSDDPDSDQKGLMILDVSEIQARTPDPQTTKIKFLTWDNVGTPQINIPVTFDGVPHLIEMDEFGGPDNVGAARIINIADETNPFVVSVVRLEANQPDAQAALVDDAGMGGLQGYRGHYCGVPTTVDPKVVGCTFILSGMRLFDISDITAPAEVAYFNVVPAREPTSTSRPTPYAMSSVTFDPVDGHVWYSDGAAGFFILDIDDDIYPPGQPEGIPVPNFTTPARTEPTAAAGGALSNSSTGGAASGATGTVSSHPATGRETPLGQIALLLGAAGVVAGLRLRTRQR